MIYAGSWGWPCKVCRGDAGRCRRDVVSCGRDGSDVGKRISHIVSEM